MEINIAINKISELDSSKSLKCLALFKVLTETVGHALLPPLLMFLF